MANTYVGNVIFVDTNAALTYARNIAGIKYIAGTAASSVTIKAGANSQGSNLWFENNTASNVFTSVSIREDKGIYVIASGTSTVYIYLKAE